MARSSDPSGAQPSGTAAPGHGDPTDPSRPRRRVGLIRLVAVAIALAAVAVTWALGGFDELEPADRVPVALGEEFYGGPWLVTVESAEVGYVDLDDQPTLVLQVNARVEVVDDRTRHLPFEMDAILTPYELAGIAPGRPVVRSLRDNSLVTDLQPGLPVRVAVLWRLEPGAAIPDEATLLVSAIERSYDDVELTGSEREHRARPGVVTVPVVDRTGTR